MQFHYVVGYDSDKKRWWVESDPEAYFPDGSVWDDTLADEEGYGWFQPDSQGSPLAYLIDERCYTMLNTLATIWPEVDHGDY